MTAALRRILLLDDDPTVRHAYERAARRHRDLQLTAVGTIDEAEALVSGDDRRFDVVVCDFWLGTRQTAKRWIRQLHRARVPVVVLSGDVGAVIRALGLRVPVFPKPLTLEQLLREVAELRGTA